MPDPLMDALPLDPNDPRIKAMGLGIRAPQLLRPLADLAKPQPPPEASKSIFAVNPVSAAVPTPAPKPLSQQYAELQGQEPKRSDPQYKVPGWKQALGLTFATLGGIGNPGRASELAEGVLHGPYNRAEQDWRNKGLAIEQQSKIGDTESQMREREAKATDLQNKPDKVITPEQDTYNSLIKQGKTPEEALEIVKSSGKADKTPPKFEHATIEDPKSPGRPLDVLFDPIKGAYIDPTTRQPIPQARSFQKPDKPEKPERTMVAVPNADGTSTVMEVRPGTVIPKGAQTISEAGKEKKATADEQRRADLANNLNENLNQLEDIARRRPELFGPIAGRATSVKQWAGPSDPDVAALATIKEQTGMAMVGAHAMRNAQHVEAASNSIFNAYKTDAKALLAPNGPIAKARASLKTFQEDVEAAKGETPVSTGTKGAPPIKGVWNTKLGKYE